MTNDERDIQRKLRVLQHAEKIGNARKACRYFGIGRSLRLPAGSGRARMAQTCFASNGRFWPTSRPLFQAMRFGLRAGSCILDIDRPPPFPPSPDVDTASTDAVYQLKKWMVLSVTQTFTPNAANGWNEPEVTDVADRMNGGYTVRLQTELNLRCLISGAENIYDVIMKNASRTAAHLRLAGSAILLALISVGQG